MTQEEWLDIFDDRMVKIGTETRRNVHKHGLWHQTFHCWVIQRSVQGEVHVLLQLRHKDKDTYPNYFDISCAGHLLAGETAEDGIRELQEELGIHADINDLTYCGKVRQVYTGSDFLDREIIHVYMHVCDQPLSSYEFQKSGISGLYFMRLSDFYELVNGQRDAAKAEGIVYDELKDALTKDTRIVAMQDITPQTAEYYEVLFNQLRIAVQSKKEGI